MKIVVVRPLLNIITIGLTGEPGAVDKNVCTSINFHPGFTFPRPDDGVSPAFEQNRTDGIIYITADILLFVRAVYNIIFNRLIGFTFDRTSLPRKDNKLPLRNIIFSRKHGEIGRVRDFHTKTNRAHILLRLLCFAGS